MAIKCTFWGLNFISDDISLLASKLNEIYNQAVVAEIKVSYVEFIYKNHENTLIIILGDYRRK